MTSFDYQFADTKVLTFCNPKVRGGMAICFNNAKCSSCDFAKKYESEHP